MQPWTGYNYDRLADDLADVIEFAGADNAAIVGFSMGGGEVARYMSRHRGKGVRQAVLIASVVPYMLKTADHPAGVDQAVFDQMAKAMTGRSREVLERLLQGLLRSRSDVTPCERRSDRMVTFDGDDGQHQGHASIAPRPLPPPTSGPTCRAFTVPTLIIHGTADKTVPIDATARLAAKRIANSKLIEYEGGPHGLLASHKDRVIADVLAFLRR